MGAVKRYTDHEARDRAICAEYGSDLRNTYRALAARYGVSHERIRQIVEAHGLPKAKAARSALRLAKKRQVLYDEFAAMAATARACIICGCWVFRGEQYLTCSPNCALTYRTSAVRLVVHHAAWLNHRKHMAKYWLRKGDATQRRHARRLLAGVVAQAGRWHLPGSATSEIIKKMCPEKLPPQPRKHEGAS